MRKCIYYGEDEKLTFNTREHIFPNCIGGMKRLDKGIVSDDANKFFANKLEVKTFRDSAVFITRYFLDYHEQFKVPEYIYNREIDSRTMDKIAINVLAHIKNKNFVMNPCFDKFKNWILKGGNDWYHCQMGEEKMFINTILPDFAHYCIFTQDEKFLIADVCLYNHWRKMFAISPRINEFETYPVGYICDWKNKKEYNFIDYVLKKCKD